MPQNPFPEKNGSHEDEYPKEITGPKNTLLLTLLHSLPEEQRRQMQILLSEPPDISSILCDREHYVASDRFFYSNDGRVMYIEEELKEPIGIIKFLHEYGHRLFGHSGDVSDMQAKEQERAAWIYAIRAFQALGHEMNTELENEVRKMWETYKEYIEKRRGCPTCGNPHGVEAAPQYYSCGVCYTDW